MRQTEKLGVQGICHATMICTDKDGNEVPFQEAMSDETREMISRLGMRPPAQRKCYGEMVPKKVDHNLVVNSGRNVMARSLGGWYETASPTQVTPYINRITLGNGTKSSNLPNLTDTGLVQELTKISGTVAGTFLLEDPHEVSPDITFPPAVTRSALGNSATVTINASGDTIMTDTGVDFINTIGVQLTDQVTFNDSLTNPTVLGVKDVLTTTTLELHNPNGFTTGAIQYSIATPGTQMLVSKLVEGNDFLQADWGVAVLVHEAGLLYFNDALFNRVVYNPSSEEVGVLLQSDEANGTEISVRFEWLITM